MTLLSSTVEDRPNPRASWKLTDYRIGLPCFEISIPSEVGGVQLLKLVRLVLKQGTHVFIMKHVFMFVSQ